jgi:hypothetical protein
LLFSDLELVIQKQSSRLYLDKPYTYGFFLHAYLKSIFLSFVGDFDLSVFSIKVIKCITAGFGHIFFLLELLRVHSPMISLPQ